MMINSPSNPTGVVYSREELTALADAVLKTDVGVLSDEIYEQLTYGDARPTCFAALRPALAERTITISGVSKTYAMTGWRMGWAVAPAPVAKFMGDIQSQETSNPCSVSQWAALEAITGPQDSVASMKQEFQKRRDFVLDRISRLPEVSCLPPGGAFYAFMNVAAHFGRTIRGREIRDSTAFCMAALSEAKVALSWGRHSERKAMRAFRLPPTFGPSRTASTRWTVSSEIEPGSISRRHRRVVKVVFRGACKRRGHGWGQIVLVESRKMG